jgi:lipopolysaccharide export system permease protein
MYLLTKTKNEQDEQSIHSLYQLIKVKKAHHLSTRIEELLLWRRLMLPITTAVMLLLAIPFVFGSLRDSSMGAKLMAGVAIGFSYYMLNDLVVPLSLLYQLPPMLTVIMPSFIFTLIAVYLIKKAS